MFSGKINFIKNRHAERFVSTVINNNAKKILGLKPKKDIKNYNKDFIEVN